MIDESRVRHAIDIMEGIYKQGFDDDVRASTVISALMVAHALRWVLDTDTGVFQSFLDGADALRDDVDALLNGSES